MLRRVRIRQVSIADYAEHADRSLIDQITASAEPLRGLRVVHINATPDGGGVAEILRSLVPLSRSLGLDAHWLFLPPDDGFFDVTKRMHNWLQGAEGQLRSRHKQTYLAHLRQIAEQAARLRADVW